MKDNNDYTLFDMLMDIYNAAEKAFDEVYSETTKSCEKCSKEKCKCEALPKRPDMALNDKQRQDVKSLVWEYINTMIVPFCKLNDQAKTDKALELYDFAAWLLKK